MDRKLIKARRKAIQAAAPCDGCGEALSACKAYRGKDPTAPPWFGCCARGLDMEPCNHVVDSRALVALLKEIERGEVRSEEDELLDSIQEYPTNFRRQVMGLLTGDWPDDVPLPLGFKRKAS